MPVPGWSRSRALRVDGSAGPTKAGSRPRGKVCYFTVTRRGAEVVAVRFGFSRRKNAQIQTTGRNWREFSRRLREQGFRLVERPDGTWGTGGATERASLQKTAGLSMRSARR